jgi:hypothetical protein
VACAGQNSNAHKVLVGKPGQRLFLGRGGRGEDNIEMDLKEIRWEVVDLIDVAQDKEVSGFCDHVNEISYSIKCRKCLTDWRTVGF